MKDLIIELLRSDKPLLFHAEEILEEIRNLGDILILKVDGERKRKNYTIVITSPKMSFDPIRREGDTASDALRKALERYVSLPY